MIEKFYFTFHALLDQQQTKNVVVVVIVVVVAAIVAITGTIFMSLVQQRHYGFHLGQIQFQTF